MTIKKSSSRCADRLGMAMKLVGRGAWLLLPPFGLLGCMFHANPRTKEDAPQVLVTGYREIDVTLTDPAGFLYPAIDYEQGKLYFLGYAPSQTLCMNRDFVDCRPSRSPGQVAEPHHSVQWNIGFEGQFQGLSLPCSDGSQDGSGLKLGLVGRTTVREEITRHAEIYGSQDVEVERSRFSGELTLYYRESPLFRQHVENLLVAENGRREGGLGMMVDPRRKVLVYLYQVGMKRKYYLFHLAAWEMPKADGSSSLPVRGDTRVISSPSRRH